MTPAKNQFVVTFLGVVCVSVLYLSWQVFLLFDGAIAFGEPMVVTDTAFTASVVTGSTTAITPKSILFTGDVMLGRNVELLSDINGSNYPYALIRPLLQRYDTVVVNFESSAAPTHVRTRAGGFTFSVKPTYIETLASYGITYASLANNHALDYGVSGYDNAQKLLRAAGITPFGHPTLVASTSVAFIPYGSQSVAVIGIHTLFAQPSAAKIREAFSAAASSSDFQIAYVHWGTEYETTHSQAQELFAKELISLGADMVIGHHPHVTQDIQIYDGVPVFYSLGNFIFDQYFSQAVQEGYALGLEFESEALHVTLHPVSSYYSRSQPQEMSEESRGSFLADLAERSNPEYADNIKQGSLIFKTPLATSSQTSMIAE